jgi:hypothetical protein
MATHALNASIKASFFMGAPRGTITILCPYWALVLIGVGLNKYNNMEFSTQSVSKYVKFIDPKGSGIAQMVRVSIVVISYGLWGNYYYTLSLLSLGLNWCRLERKYNNLEFSTQSVSKYVQFIGSKGSDIAQMVKASIVVPSYALWGNYYYTLALLSLGLHSL